MYDTGQQALPSAGLALEQQRGDRSLAWRIKAPELLDLRPQGSDGGRGPYQAS
jgi:hypothetical protein